MLKAILFRHMFSNAQPCYITEEEHFQGIRLSKKKHWDKVSGYTACHIASLGGLLDELRL